MRMISKLLYTCSIDLILLSSIHAQELLKISLPEANAFLDVSFKYKEVFVGDIRIEEINMDDRKDIRVVCMENMQKFPLYAAILLDASGSQQLHSADTHQLYDEMIGAISLRPGDLASLIVFNHEINVIQDSTRDKALLREGFSKVRFWGGTRLNDSISTVSNVLNERKSSIKTLVIISDGEDRDSSLGIEEAYQKALENNLRIYMFARKIRQNTGIFVNPQVGQYKKHAKYIQKTGGRIFEYADLESARQQISILMDEWNNLKRIGFFIDPSKKPISDIKLSVSRKGVKATYPSTLQYID